MANCISGGAIPTYQINAQNCGEDGRIVALAIIDDNVTFTQLTDPAEWTPHVTSGAIRIHKKVRGSYPPATPVQQAGMGNQGQRTVGATHTATIAIPYVRGNSTYWDNMMKSNNKKIAFVVGADYDKLYYVDSTVSISAYSNVGEDLNSELFWQGVFSWNKLENPEIVGVPAGIFTGEE